MTKTNGSPPSPTAGCTMPASCEMPSIQPDLCATTVPEGSRAGIASLICWAARTARTSRESSGESRRLGPQRLQGPGQVGGGDDVLQTGLAGGRVLDAAGDRAVARPDPIEDGRHRRRADGVEHEVGGEVAGPHDRPVAEPAQRDVLAEVPPGLRVAVLLRVDREDGPVVPGGEGVVHAHRDVEVERPCRGLSVGGHHERELHRAGGVVRLVGAVREVRVAGARPEPDREAAAGGQCVDVRREAGGLRGRHEDPGYGAGAGPRRRA